MISYYYSAIIVFSITVFFIVAIFKNIVNKFRLYDRITGLYNRITFFELIEHQIDLARDNGYCPHLFLINIDRFKETVQILGYHGGDLLLKAISDRIKECTEETDIIGSLGGEQLAILVPNPDCHCCKNLGEGIIKSFQSPFFILDTKIDVFLSIGISKFPDHGTDPTELFKSTSLALLTASDEKIGWSCYAKEKNKNTIEHLSLPGDLRDSIKKGQMEVYFQPKKDLRNGKIIGVESLVRWNHPTMGIISPDRFIPLAEQIGVINHITEFVLKVSISQIVEWKKMGLDISVSVNISAENLNDYDLLVIVSREIERHQIDPNKLILEVTETSIMRNQETSIKALICLESMGVKLSIDDFGTGHASFLYLKHLPVSELKIDRSFISEILTSKQDQNIVRSTIKLAHETGCLVVAEGVEDGEIENLLKEMGCDLIQGYHLSKPGKEEDITKWIKESEEQDNGL